MPVAQKQAVGVHFIVSTDTNKADADTRKFIRSHVMLGKNLGKARPRKKKAKAKDANTGGVSSQTNREEEAPPEEQPQQPLPKPGTQSSGTSDESTCLPIPPRVGGEFCFTDFADTIRPGILNDVIVFSTESKKVLFPLEPCFSFEKHKSQWWDALMQDPAYINTVAFMSHTYVNLIRGYPGRSLTNDSTIHLVKTVHLLRQRLTAGPGPLLYSDSTMYIVLMLATYAHMIGETQTARHHMLGLRKLILMRGGLRTFRNSKLILEVLRTDLGISLHNGLRPVFYLDTPFFEPLEPYPNNTQFLVARGGPRHQPNDAEKFFKDIDPGLLQAWIFMKEFAALMNVTYGTENRLPQDTLLNTMTSIMYRLIDMHFSPNSMDETIRLGLLAFCSHVFLRWQTVRLGYTHLPYAYKSSLVNLNFSKDFSPQVMLWLLMVGAISIFERDDDVWLKPWLKVNIDLCGVESWGEMRGKLKELMWVELVQDEAGEEAYNSCVGERIQII
ncbi:hypothetical protein TWF694_005934 [Orbilia ellipsospora]|uniref:Uncharacterized protein n=1 Tax=Orbilia ellipsospora TaxID=2528407 RepID=A0AAV9WTZ3_9PEZI